MNLLPQVPELQSQLVRSPGDLGIQSGAGDLSYKYGVIGALDGFHQFAFQPGGCVLQDRAAIRGGAHPVPVEAAFPGDRGFKEAEGDLLLSLAQDIEIVYPAFLDQCVGA